MMKPYVISDDGRAITCRRCGLTSHNPNDVAQRYCGRCHVFHEDPRQPVFATARKVLDHLAAAKEELDAIEQRRRLDKAPSEQRVEEAEKIATLRASLARLEATIREFLQ
jgi:ribosomal protein L37E